MSPDASSDASSDAVLPDAGVDAGLALCLDDDFEDRDASDWTIVDPAWAVQAGAGPDNSLAFVAPNTFGDAMITHPAIRSIVSARISLDFRIDSGVAGDFSLYLAKPGWTVPNDDVTQRYFASLYAVGSDSAPDRIARRVPPATAVNVATHPVSVVAGTWHHVELLYRADGSIRVDLDQTAYMESQPDGTLAPPFDLIIRFWAHGAIDNVRVECVR
jgi:hypothetical protein